MSFSGVLDYDTFKLFYIAFFLFDDIVVRFLLFYAPNFWFTFIEMNFLFFDELGGLEL